MRPKYQLLAFFLLFSVSMNGLTRAQRLNYTVDLHETAKHYVHVTLRPTGAGASTASFQMPVWAPGAYSVTHYGLYVHGITAMDEKGKALSIKRINDDRWEIAGAQHLAEISYDILDSHKDTTSLYFGMANMDSAFFFANATCLFGYLNDHKGWPATVHYSKPEAWHLATALDPAPSKLPEQAGEFRHVDFVAKDYDELVDAPIMAGPQFQTRTFDEGTAKYDVVLVSSRPFPMDSLAEYTKQIVRAETEFFHDTPFKHYTFLIYAPTVFNLPSGAQGALEHANSSDYLLVNLPWNSFKSFGLSILSHEFFHLWNVKRIHSSLLGPFDYTERVKTTSLWLAEGITDYYAHTLLTRAKIVPTWNFYDDIRNWLNAMLYAKGAREYSLEQLSIMESAFDLEYAELFYTKGPLVGLLLDIEIRTQTQNKKSLDDVMLALNKEAKQGKTFKDADLIGHISKLSGTDLSDFYSHYIAGTDSLPLETYLTKMGLRKTVVDTANGAKLHQSTRIGINSATGNLTLADVGSSGALAKAGLQAGDDLVTINGEKLSLENLDKLTSPGDAKSVKLGILRGGKPMDVTIDLDAARESSPKEEAHAYEPNPDATPMQRAIREAILEKL